MQFPVKLQDIQKQYQENYPYEPLNHEQPQPVEQKCGDGQAEVANEQLKRSFKWTCEEHAKYIHFLEMNKEKVKSKLVRKSNAFFKEMELYLKTKTSIQCRSHHQKFEEKYRFPHRIIAGQKKHIPLAIYHQTVDQAPLQHLVVSSLQVNAKDPKTGLQGGKQRSRGVEVSCQTDLCDLRLQYVLVGQGEKARMAQPYYPYVPPYGVYRQPYYFLY